MNKLKVPFWVLLIFLNLTLPFKLPSSFKKCQKNQENFDQCLKEAIEGTIKQMNKPIQELQVPNMEPIEIPSATVESGVGAVLTVQDYKNLRIFGTTSAKIVNCSLDFDNNKLTISAMIPEILMEFQYQLNGTVLSFRIYGTGPGTITIVEPQIFITFTFDEYVKDKEIYFKIGKCEFKMKPKLILTNFENLFDGNKIMGDNVNKVINENWKEIYADIGSNYEILFGQIYSSVFGQILDKVSIFELFGAK